MPSLAFVMLGLYAAAIILSGAITLVIGVFRREVEGLKIGGGVAGLGAALLLLAKLGGA
uniref:hypothetical protein n=1 Tax=Marinobacterium profundum TaxID=1714300 RepID=UPI000B13D67E|nr:hypothetical protein [Marinobacterium profundum]